MRFISCGLILAAITASGVDGANEPMNWRQFTQFVFPEHASYHDVYAAWEFSRMRGQGAAERMIQFSCSAGGALESTEGRAFELWTTSMFPDLEYNRPVGEVAPGDGEEDATMKEFFIKNVWLGCRGILMDWLKLTPFALAIFIKFGIGSRNRVLSEATTRFWAGSEDNPVAPMGTKVSDIERSSFDRVLELTIIRWNELIGNGVAADDSLQLEKILHYVMRSLSNEGGHRAGVPVAAVHPHHDEVGPLAAAMPHGGKIMGFMEFAEGLMSEYSFKCLKSGWEYLLAHRDQEDLLVLISGGNLFTTAPVGSPSFELVIHSIFYSPPSGDKEERLREWMNDYDITGPFELMLIGLCDGCKSSKGEWCRRLKSWLQRGPVAIGVFFSFSPDFVSIGYEVMERLFSDPNVAPLPKNWHLYPPGGIQLATEAASRAIAALDDPTLPIVSDEALRRVMVSMMNWRAEPAPAAAE